MKKYYRLKHIDTGLYYCPVYRLNGVRTNLHEEGALYPFKPTARGRGNRYRNHFTRWETQAMVEADWEAEPFPIVKPVTNLSKKLNDAFGRGIDILALGYVRYETLRKLSPKQFSDLYKRNIKENIPFDKLVDELANQSP